MNTARLSKLILEVLAEQVSQLTEVDIQKLEKGTHELALSLVKKKSTLVGGAELSEVQMVELLSNLQDCESRDQGYELISRALKNKKELEQFAKHLDVLVLKQDKVDQVKEKIIEATVGAILRSNAIQGKNITRP